MISRRSKLFRARTARALLRVAAGLLACSIPAVTWADSAARQVTLREALLEASREPPRVQAAVSRARESEAQAHLERGAWLPHLVSEVGAQIGYDQRPYAIANADGTESVQRLAATSQSVGASGTLAWTATDFGARQGRTTAAKSTAAAEAARAEVERRSAVRDAASLYIDALAARALVEDAKETVHRRELEGEAVDRLVKAGVRPSVDRMRAEVELIAARAALVQRTYRSQAAYAALAVALGALPEEKLDLAPLDSAYLDQLSKQGCPALDRRPEAIASSLDLEASERRAQAARAERRPSVDLELSSQATSYGVLNGIGISGPIVGASAGVVLRWNGLDATVWRKANVAEAAVVSAEKNRNATMLAVRSDVAQAAYSVEMGRAGLEQAEELREVATATRDAQQARYRAGVSSLLELLDAESLEQNARVRLIDAQRAFDTARVQYLYACGVLVP